MLLEWTTTDFPSESCWKRSVERTGKADPGSVEKTDIISGQTFYSAYRTAQNRDAWKDYIHGANAITDMTSA